jgi:hypothetical protein
VGYNLIRVDYEKKRTDLSLEPIGLMSDGVTKYSQNIDRYRVLVHGCKFYRNGSIIPESLIDFGFANDLVSVGFID